MTVKPNKQIFIELDGKTYELRFPWKAFCLLEQEVGLAFSDIAIQMERGSFGFSRATQILWAALAYAENPNDMNSKWIFPFTISELENILDARKLEFYTDLFGEAWKVAFPDEEKDSEGKNEEGSKTEKNGPGKDTSEKVTK